MMWETTATSIRILCMWNNVWLSIDNQKLNLALLDKWILAIFILDASNEREKENH